MAKKKKHVAIEAALNSIAIEHLNVRTQIKESPNYKVTLEAAIRLRAAASKLQSAIRTYERRQRRANCTHPYEKVQFYGAVDMPNSTSRCRLCGTNFTHDQTAQRAILYKEAQEIGAYTRQRRDDEQAKIDRASLN
jgi:hypothetical protein